MTGSEGGGVEGRAAPSWRTSARYVGVAIVLVGAATVGLVAARWGAEVAGPQIGAAPTATGATVGEALYLVHCAACHGDLGQGQPGWQSPGADGIYPAPPHDPSGHSWHHPDQMLLAIVSQGGGAYANPTGMPAFAGVLGPDEMAEVLAHIKTFWGPEELAHQADQTAQWARALDATAPAAESSAEP